MARTTTCSTSMMEPDFQPNRWTWMRRGEDREMRFDFEGLIELKNKFTVEEYFV